MGSCEFRNEPNICFQSAFFRYTVLEPGESLTPSDDHRAVVIVLAVLFGVFGLLLLGLLLWPCLRRREPATSEAKSTSSRQSSYKWGGGAKDGGSVARQDRSGPSSSLPPPAPHTSSPPSRPNSGEPWSASSVGGPGVQNMTGIGTSARNSHAIGYHQGDHQHSASHFVVSQGNSAGAYDTTPYSNHNLNYPQI